MPRWRAFGVRTTRGGSGRIRAAADFPPGGLRAEAQCAKAGAGRRTRAGQRRRCHGELGEPLVVLPLTILVVLGVQIYTPLDYS